MAGNRKVPTLKGKAFKASFTKQGLFREDIKATYISPGQITIEGKNGLLPSYIVEKVTKRFLQAVINDDRQTVKEMLDKMPQLLLVTPDPGLVIESQYTWQKFYAEPALTMACKLKQIKMTELLLSYYDKLPQDDDVIKAKTAGLCAWKPYVNKVNDDGENEILIPQEYARLAQSLVDVFREETFPNGIPGENNIPRNIELSEPTEAALLSLLDILVPKQAVKLDECIDAELLLLAIYQAYLKNFTTFNHNWDKLDALCIRVMGLIQSALIPESGKIFCESLYDVVTEMDRGKVREISPMANAYKMKGGEKFYRENRETRVGNGFEVLCGVIGGPQSKATIGDDPGVYFGKTMSNKNNRFSEYYAAAAATATPTRCSK
ncbi:MAG TPA: hypothetical protein VL360_01240 [Gammaproteobacteria bacterium]|jgi:hypothetical protein|nr:hypothetical protein [Gammaproteobacteria bacterium]